MVKLARAIDLPREGVPLGDMGADWTCEIGDGECLFSGSEIRTRKQFSTAKVITKTTLTLPFLSLTPTRLFRAMISRQSSGESSFGARLNAARQIRQKFVLTISKSGTSTIDDLPG
jgi:hypothetical protein